jgi:hypothetical protein
MGRRGREVRWGGGAVGAGILLSRAAPRQTPGATGRGSLAARIAAPNGSRVSDVGEREHWRLRRGGVPVCSRVRFGGEG